MDYEYQITVRMSVDSRFHPTEHQRSGLDEALAATMSGTMLMKPAVTWENRRHAVIVLRVVNTEAHSAGESARRLVEDNAAQHGICVTSADVIGIVRRDVWPGRHGAD